MIQVNLLPEIKLKYIKAKKTERLVLFVSVIICAACIAVMVLLYLTVDVFQKNSLTSTANKITADSSQLQSNTNLNKIITIQQQLNSLPNLYKARNNPASILSYLGQVASPGITISTFTINYQTGALTLSGTAPNLLAGNVFYNTMLYAQYTTNGSSTGGSNLFSNVMFSGLTSAPSGSSSGSSSSSTSSSNSTVTYSATATMPSSLFLNGVNVHIYIPSKDVTKSALEQPTAIPSASTFTK
jgi:hypothetical protein